MTTPFVPKYIPRATEKAYNLQNQNTYVFYAPKSASKQAIAKTIAEAFKVTIINVRTINRKGKATRFSRGKHAYPGTTYREDHKIAYITVKDGDKIPVFDEPAEEPKAEEKSKAKADKKAAKPAKKTKTADKEEK